MEIQKNEIRLIAGCAVAGVIFMLVVTKGGILFSLVLGTICGAGGGCLGCLFRRWMGRHSHAERTEIEEQDQALEETSQ